MKYYCSNKIKNVRSFELSKDGYVVTFGSEVNLIKDNDNVRVLYNGDVWFGLIFKNNVIYQQKNGAPIEYINLDTLDNGSINDFHFYLFKNVRKDINTLLIKTDKHNVELKEDFSLTDSIMKGRLPKEILESNAIYISNKIVCKNIQNDEINWERAFNVISSGVEVKTYGGTILLDRQIYIYLFNREQNISMTACLKLETGEILFKTKDFGGWLTTFKNKIYSVYDKKIQILNPKSFEISNIDLSQTLTTLNEQVTLEGDSNLYSKTFFLSNKFYSIDENYFYFTEDKGSTLGLINLSTKKIEWLFNLEKNDSSNSVITDFKVYDDKIYVLDQGNTLHIFKKENTATS